jgi:hypothetical protein
MTWLFQGSEAELRSLSDPDFVGVWSALFGTPPKTMLGRPAMIAQMREALRPRGLRVEIMPPESASAPASPITEAL